MGDNFLRFKSKLVKVRILKSILAGLSAGVMTFGICNLLSRLAIVGFEPIISLPIGIGALVFSGIVTYFLLGKSDKALAKELDTEFGLHEKIQTMIDYRDEYGEIIDIQRRDAEETLNRITTKKYKAKGLWIYIAAAVLSAAVGASSFIADNMRNYTPPEIIPPFELSAMQEAGLEELIAYVTDSEMEEPYRTKIAVEIGSLLDELRIATTQPEMQAALGETMAYVLSITCDSSSSAEILNALWSNGNVNLKHLAKMLDTSKWTNPEWGEFAEAVNEYLLAVYGDSSDDLRSALDSTARNVDLALYGSDIKSDDALYAVLNKLMNVNETQGAEHLYGYAAISALIGDMTYDEAKAEVKATFDIMTNEIYAVVSGLKMNTNVGEYAMTKLSTLFLVPLPEFERPEFVKKGESIGGGSSDSNDDELGGSAGGGVGEGATFGSKDLVLDPISGNYVEYGTLINTYHALMLEKLESGSYTEEQKKAIENYFDLLYKGMDKEEGN